MRRPAAVLAALFVLLAVAVACGQAAASPLSSTALWVNRPTSAAAIASAAGESSVKTVFLKAAEGATAEPAYTPALVAELHGAGLGVCAWTFDRGSESAGEAAAAIAAVRAGASCLVVDAEGEYDGHYGAAQAFVAALRHALGASFPIGLAGQAETFEHPAFPYSVFLGPGGFQFTMPQMYWHELGLSVQRAFSLAIPENLIYGRPVLPVGQLFDGVTAEEASSFLVASFEHGAPGVSFFDLDAAEPAQLAALAPKPIPMLLLRTRPATVRPGADNDAVVWAQELLNAAGARLPVGGYFGAQTEHAIVRFQARRRLRRTGLLDAATWHALLRLKAREPSWAKAPPLSARQQP